MCRIGNAGRVAPRRSSPNRKYRAATVETPAKRHRPQDMIWRPREFRPHEQPPRFRQSSAAARCVTPTCMLWRLHHHENPAAQDSGKFSASAVPNFAAPYSPALLSIFLRLFVVEGRSSRMLLCYVVMPSSTSHQADHVLSSVFSSDFSPPDSLSDFSLRSPRSLLSRSSSSSFLWWCFLLGRSPLL